MAFKRSDANNSMNLIDQIECLLQAKVLFSSLPLPPFLHRRRNRREIRSDCTSWLIAQVAPRRGDQSRLVMRPEAFSEVGCLRLRRSLNLKETEGYGLVLGLCELYYT